MEAKHFIELEEHYGAHNYHPLDVVLEKGEGVWVWDVEGRQYLDCLSAYSAISHGHRHPQIMAALLAQAQKITLTSRAFRNDQLGPFYEELSRLTGYEMVLPMNTGAEAVETALKLARKWGYERKGIAANRAEIIVAANNFHGRTISLISASTEPLYRDAFGPHTPGFVIVPYGQAAALEQALTANTAAVLLEPIQGEAGVIVPPAGYLQQVAAICQKNKVLLITDEIQTGLGRTGKLLAGDHEGIRADVVILGKALGGGVLPLSAVISSRDILGLFRPGEHGSTFGGNPLACAVGRAALRTLADEHLVENAAQIGEYFQERLAEIPSRHIKEVRGQGLLIGVELLPAAGGARRFSEALQHRGVLCKETHENVLRFAPPLIIDRATVDWALPLISDVLCMA